MFSLRPDNGKIVILGEEYFRIPREMLDAIRRHLIKSIQGVNADVVKSRVNAHFNGVRHKRKVKMMVMSVCLLTCMHTHSICLQKLLKSKLVDKEGNMIVGPHPIYAAVYHDYKRGTHVFDEACPLFDTYSDEERDQFWHTYGPLWKERVVRLREMNLVMLACDDALK